MGMLIMTGFYIHVNKITHFLKTMMDVYFFQPVIV